MKLKLLLFALVVVAGAALWAVNWRLNNPPLSRADKEFRALVKGADKTELRRMSWPPKIGSSDPTRTLNPAQTRELIERLRFVTTVTTSSSLGTSTPKGAVLWDLIFWRAGRKPVYFVLAQTPQQSVLQSSNLGGVVVAYELHPRFEKPLRAYLEEVGPRP